MGWLNKKQRKQVFKKFKVLAYYMCDYCHKPIADQVPVIDPKKGYFIVDVGSQISSRFIKEPKRTYHSTYCNDRRMGKKVRRVPSLSKKQQAITDQVWEVLKKKRNQPGYWTLDRLKSKLPDTKESRVLRAVKHLKQLKRIKKKRGGYVPRA